MNICYPKITWTVMRFNVMAVPLKIYLNALLWMACVLTVLSLQAEEYLSQEAFIKQVFKNNTPKTTLYWLSDQDKKVAQAILGHPFKRARLRYWQAEQKTLWILEEIGKVKPITIGLAIDQNKIVDLQILAFRESRGWEVKNRAFTQQFYQQTLTEKYELTHQVDGIAGATLSVRAVSRVARLALYLSSQTAITPNGQRPMPPQH
jgi:Na+-translocating ferredoxin:NAD+ oxidoreductase RnfG subunit